MAIDIRPRVAVLDHDPDLAQDVPPDQLGVARARAIARAATLPPGAWHPPAPPPGSHGDFGLLVLAGTLTRNVSLLGRVTMELLGAEDLLRPWDDCDPGASSVPHEVSWTVLEPARLAVLDRGFAHRVAPWPGIAAALVARASRRSRRLDEHLAILENPSVETRVLLYLWHLADRWGRVRPGGVALGVHVTHQTLGRLVRAHRPSVTRAVSQLEARGCVRREPGGDWVLLGPPPSAATAWEATVTTV